jgi:predicted nucleic acid-binding protein
MVLVDTSVWVRFLYNKAPWATELDHLLSQKQVAVHDLVYGELMVGDTGGRKNLLDSLPDFPQVGTLQHEDVVLFVQRHNLQAQGVGWIDIHLLASAVASRVQFWTVDPRLHALAQRFKVAYSVASNR